MSGSTIMKKTYLEFHQLNEVQGEIPSFSNPRLLKQPWHLSHY